MAEIAENTIVDGRYRVIRRIGAGGMADVYLAEDSHLGRQVALKLLHRRFSQDQEFVERFRREASAAAGLQHPNVVGVYDRGSFDDTYYIAMEYCEGETLKQVIDRDAPMDPTRAIEITKQILIAARFAHKHGVIHRDLKPQNVMLDAEDHAKVMDFGIARAGGSEITEVGAIMGTAQYLSPEQAQGADVTAASDLYSIGVVLFEMLTGHTPFSGDTAVAVALKHVSEEPRSPRQFVPIAPALEAIVMKSLAKLPTDRYTDADSFIADLDEAALRLDEPSEPPDSTARIAAVAVPLPAEPAQAAATDATAVAPEPVSGEVVDSYPPTGLPPDEEEQRRRRRRNLIIVGSIIGVVLAALIVALLLRGPEQVEMPSVISEPQAVAQEKLERLGFKVDTQSRPADAAAGVVIEQFPRANTKVDKGSTVTITISSGPSTVKVPDVIGDTKSTARDRIKRAGLKPAFRNESSTTVGSGLVIRTDPGPDNKIDRGDPVTVYVSTGAKLVAVPDVTGLQRDEAKQQLSDKGFSVVVEQKSSDQPSGQVVSQSPGGGQQVDEGSTVTIFVSNGQQVAVPNVVGLSKGEAQGEIDGAGLSSSTTAKTVTDPADDGIVLSQSPGGGTRRSKGSVVTITVGQLDPNSGETP